MPTIKQERAVAALVDNHGNVSQAMLKVGYSPQSAKNPKNLTESQGYQELLQKYLPDNLILESLESDIRNKPKNRLGELALAAKIKGMEVNRIDLQGKLGVYSTMEEDELDKAIEQQTREVKVIDATRGEEEKNQTKSSKVS